VCVCVCVCVCACVCSSAADPRRAAHAARIARRPHTHHLRHSHPHHERNERVLYRFNHRGRRHPFRWHLRDCVPARGPRARLEVGAQGGGHMRWGDPRPHMCVRSSKPRALHLLSCLTRNPPSRAAFPINVNFEVDPRTCKATSVHAVGAQTFDAGGGFDQYDAALFVLGGDLPH